MFDNNFDFNMLSHIHREKGCKLTAANADLRPLPTLNQSHI